MVDQLFGSKHFVFLQLWMKQPRHTYKTNRWHWNLHRIALHTHQPSMFHWCIQNISLRHSCTIIHTINITGDGEQLHIHQQPIYPSGLISTKENQDLYTQWHFFLNNLFLFFHDSHLRLPSWHRKDFLEIRRSTMKRRWNTVKLSLTLCFPIVISNWCKIPFLAERWTKDKLW